MAKTMQDSRNEGTLRGSHFRSLAAQRYVAQHGIPNQPPRVWATSGGNLTRVRFGNFGMVLPYVGENPAAIAEQIQTTRTLMQQGANNRAIGRLGRKSRFGALILSNVEGCLGFTYLSSIVFHT